jgi:hypothetical protein
MKRSPRMAQADLDAIYKKMAPKPAWGESPLGLKSGWEGSAVPVFSKYGNKKVEWQGMKFDSKRELARYQDLLLLEKAGQIQDLKRQVVFVLAKSVKFIDSLRARPALRYVSDFTYTKDGEFIIEDAKGFRSEKYLIKKHLMLALLGLHITET